MRIYSWLPPLAIVLTLGACSTAVWHKPQAMPPAIVREESKYECQGEVPQETRESNKSVPVQARRSVKPAAQKAGPKPEPAKTELSKPAEAIQTSNTPQFGADGRLMHPWYNALQITDY